MAIDLRSFAVATAGFASFVNLYSPQALLPQLASEFHVSAGEISELMTAGTGAIALTAPFTGVLADIVGRKRLITAANEEGGVDPVHRIRERRFCRLPDDHFLLFDRQNRTQPAARANS